MLECLDIAAPSTLGRMRNASEYENPHPGQGEGNQTHWQFEGYLQHYDDLNLTQQLLFGGDTVTRACACACARARASALACAHPMATRTRLAMHTHACVHKMRVR